MQSFTQDVEAAKDALAAVDVGSAEAAVEAVAAEAATASGQISDFL